MKVIQRGPDFQNFPLTCRVCQSQLEVEKDDIQYYYDDDPRGGSSYYFVICAVCGERLPVKDANVPAVMGKRLMSSR